MPKSAIRTCPSKSNKMLSSFKSLMMEKSKIWLKSWIGLLKGKKGDFSEKLFSSVIFESLRISRCYCIVYRVVFVSSPKIIKSHVSINRFRRICFNSTKFVIFGQLVTLILIYIGPLTNNHQLQPTIPLTDKWFLFCVKTSIPIRFQPHKIWLLALETARSLEYGTLSRRHLNTPWQKKDDSKRFR